MSVEEREGVLDQVSEKGIFLSGARLSYSKWFEGDRPTEDALGCKIRVVVDAGEKCTFLKKIVRIGEKANGWKPQEPSNKGFFGGGGGRRFSPEELELKRDEGVRIARSVAIDRAITMAKEGIPIEKVASLAQVIEEYVLKGKFPLEATSLKKEEPRKSAPEKPPGPSPAKSVPAVHPESPRPPAPAKEAAPPAPSKPKRLAARVVSGLFNEALRGGLVEDWRDYLAYIEGVLKVQVKNPYQLNAAEFARVEAILRSKLGQAA